MDNISITEASKFSGNIFAPNIYTKSEVGTALAFKSTSTDITTALSVTSAKSATYTNSDVDTALSL